MSNHSFKWVHIENQDELEKFYISILPRIREEARKLGFAIGVHGSMRRDLDLIAVPWVEKYNENILAEKIQYAACGMANDTFTWEIKPNGRRATSFPVCWTWDSTPPIISNGHIDLSVVIGCQCNESGNSRQQGRG